VNHRDPGSGDPQAPPRRPRGGVIAVGGPDGVGKTTLCDALVADVLEGREVLHVRFPGLLPRRDPVARRELRLGPGREPDLTRLRVYPPPYRPLTAVAKVTYLWIDFLLGWLVRVRPLVRRGGWVVFERGWWDHAVDPRRYRLRPPARLVGALGRLLPRADVVFVLQAPAEVIRARRPELTEEELRRQMEAWERVLPARQRRVVVDTTRPLDELIEDARGTVEDIAGAAAAGRAA
jgi:thymidylate kinase